MAKSTPSIEVLEYEKNIAGNKSAQNPHSNRYCCFCVKRVDDKHHPAKRDHTIVKNTDIRIGPPNVA